MASLRHGLFQLDLFKELPASQDIAWSNRMIATRPVLLSILHTIEVDISPFEVAACFFSINDTVTAFHPLHKYSLDTESLNESIFNKCNSNALPQCFVVWTLFKLQALWIWQCEYFKSRQTACAECIFC